MIRTSEPKPEVKPTTFQFQCTKCTNKVAFDVAGFEMNVRKTRPSTDHPRLKEVGLVCPACGAWHVLFYSNWKAEMRRASALNEHNPIKRAKLRAGYEKLIDEINAPFQVKTDEIPNPDR